MLARQRMIEQLAGKEMMTWHGTGMVLGSGQ
jgi:hypothetical protein